MSSILETIYRRIRRSEVELECPAGLFNWDRFLVNYNKKLFDKPIPHRDTQFLFKAAHNGANEGVQLTLLPNIKAIQIKLNGQEFGIEFRWNPMATRPSDRIGTMETINGDLTFKRTNTTADGIIFSVIGRLSENCIIIDIPGEKQITVSYI